MSEELPKCGDSLPSGGRWWCSYACGYAGRHMGHGVFNPTEWCMTTQAGEPAPGATVREQALKADAERLAELRELSYQARELVEVSHGAERRRHEVEHARLRVLIAVYEECAARGRTFGGVG